MKKKKYLVTNKPQKICYMENCMKMKKKKYLPVYYKWMKSGLPNNGLCNCLKNGDVPDRLLELFEPPYELNNKWMFWGHGGSHPDRYPNGLWERGFTGLRQTIILFMAAMNNEL